MVLALVEDLDNVAVGLRIQQLKNVRAGRQDLSAHARTLDEAGYIVIEKSFRGRRPYTAMRLAPKGRRAFERYLETLRQIIDRGTRGAEDSS